MCCAAPLWTARTPSSSSAAATWSGFCRATGSSPQPPSRLPGTWRSGAAARTGATSWTSFPRWPPMCTGGTSRCSFVSSGSCPARRSTTASSACSLPSPPRLASSPPTPRTWMACPCSTRSKLLTRRRLRPPATPATGSALQPGSLSRCSCRSRTTASTPASGPWPRSPGRQAPPRQRRLLAGRKPLQPLPLRQRRQAPRPQQSKEPLPRRKPAPPRQHGQALRWPPPAWSPCARCTWTGALAPSSLAAASPRLSSCLGI
mmetsp:Transcript_23100/g.87366  ORF Transcript_23100/g.87366 Transcript_23100/m.87366 type:complete len:260 (-) Transcript_23100:8770-9549(-)